MIHQYKLDDTFISILDFLHSFYHYFLYVYTFYIYYTIFKVKVCWIGYEIFDYDFDLFCFCCIDSCVLIFNDLI